MVPEISPGPELPATGGIAAGSALRRAELNLPNLITLGRLCSVPLAIWLILGERYDAAFWVFIVAGLSDGVDGYIAKRFDRRTRLGALLDPAADKALLVGVYVTLAIAGQLPAWLVGLVMLRDLLIVLGYLWLQNASAPKQFGPLTISKINTLVQLVLVGFVLARGIGVDSAAVKELLVAAAATTTVASGMAYLARCARLVLRGEPQR